MNYKWFWNTFSSFGYSVLFSSFFTFISRDPISKIGILFPYAASLRKKSSEIKKGHAKIFCCWVGYTLNPLRAIVYLGFYCSKELAIWPKEIWIVLLLTYLLCFYGILCNIFNGYHLELVKAPPDSKVLFLQNGIIGINRNYIACNKTKKTNQSSNAFCSER